MKACCVENQDVHIFLFGDDIGIEDFCEYVKIQDGRNYLRINEQLKRISKHKIYGFGKAQTLRGISFAIEFNIGMKKMGRKVKGSDWDEAWVISFPEAAKEFLKLTDEEIEAIAKNLKWTKIGI